MTPFIIPIFISHQGCPHQCVFCNQGAIAGSTDVPVSPAQVAGLIAEQLAWPRKTGRQEEVQVAFYGGSFTCLDQERQQAYLRAVQPFLDRGQVAKVRLSTRPDCLDLPTALWLREQGVGLVEVGVQSLDEEVLLASRRGHDGAQVAAAFGALREAGLQSCGQLMVGLPGDTPARAVASARRLLEMGPDMVRIYPTLVVAGSPLAELYEQKKFQPWSLAKAVLVCARLKEICEKARVKVIRLGLQPSQALKASVLAGPFHPAFGEMVASRIFFKYLRSLLRRRPAGPALLRLSPRDRSLFSGVGKENLQRLQGLGLLKGVEVVFASKQPRFSAAILPG
ncbi:MAG: radical SAM protein [Thermodesulfobacteriota bacterium]